MLRCLGLVWVLLALSWGLTDEEIEQLETLDKTHFRIVTIKSPPFVYQSQVIQPFPHIQYPGTSWTLLCQTIWS